MKKILFALVTASLIATPAMARLHSSEERDRVIKTCAQIADATDAGRKRALDVIENDPEISAEDKDYVLDMCSSFAAGKKSGLQFAIDLYSR